MTSIEAAIRFLVEKKFGIYATFAPLLSTLKPSEGTDLSMKSAEMEEYKRTLRNMAPDALLTLHQQSLAQDAEQVNQTAIQEENNRFYHQESANADFEHWSKADFWTIDEAIALSLGKEPGIVTWKKIEPLKNQSTLANAFAKRQDLARRSSFVKPFGDAIPPVYFIDWANNINLELPKALLEAVENNAGRAINWREQYINLQQEFENVAAQEKPESTRKSENLLQALTCIAIDAYGFDPKSAKSTAPQDIADALAKHGKKIDAKTIRTWLKEGLELLPPGPDTA